MVSSEEYRERERDYLPVCVQLTVLDWQRTHWNAEMVAGWLVGSTNADICKWKKEPRLSVDLCTWRNDCCCWSTLLHCSLVVTLKSKDGDGEKTGKDKAGQWNKAAKRKKTLAKTNFRFDVTFFPLLPHWLNSALNSLPNLKKKGEWKRALSLVGNSSCPV